MTAAAFTGLLLTILSGLYIHLTETWTTPYRLNLILHPVEGALTVALLALYLRGHVQQKRQGRRSGVAAGWLSALLWGGALATGLLIAPGAGHHVDRILVHRWLAYGAAAVALVHVAPAWTRLAPAPRRAALTLLLAGLAGLGALAATRPTQPVTVDFEAALAGETSPPTNTDLRLLSATKTCGATDGCHAELTREFEAGTHRLAPTAPHFRKIVALLEEERGAESTRFCASCHAPGEALGAAPPNHPRPAFGCLVCHAMDQAHIADETSVAAGPEAGYAGPRKGYTLGLPAAHLTMFPPDGEMEPAGIDRYLIELNPLGHGRALRPDLLKADALCRSCHQEHIPAAQTGAFERLGCVDCHMRLQTPFSKSGSDRPHLFLAANVVLPRLTEDRERLASTLSWLSGNFPPAATDSFWELRTGNDARPSRAFWLVVSIEALEQAGVEANLPVRVHTSNVGIGHPFPTGVLDMYDVWLELRAADADGRVFFTSGRPGGIYHTEDGIHRLGGTFFDSAGRPILRHRVWEKSRVSKRVVEPGRTIEDDFDVRIPSGVGPRIVLTARWLYSRINSPFMLWAYPDLPGARDGFEAVEMAAARQQIVLEGPVDRAQ
ncbi:MAG: hypothetical protein HYY13_05570 [Nitrospirae bacterium]|nr:hypothetical protein [Nitrospirota bacterium]